MSKRKNNNPDEYGEEYRYVSPDDAICSLTDAQDYFTLTQDEVNNTIVAILDSRGIDSRNFTPNF